MSSASELLSVDSCFSAEGATTSCIAFKMYGCHITKKHYWCWQIGVRDDFKSFVKKLDPSPKSVVFQQRKAKGQSDESPLYDSDFFSFIIATERHACKLWHISPMHSYIIEASIL